MSCKSCRVPKGMALCLPLVAHNFLEAVTHAIVVVGARSRASLELPVMCVSQDRVLRMWGEAYTLVLTTSRGYLGMAVSIDNDIVTIRTHWYIHHQNLKAHHC